MNLDDSDDVHVAVDLCPPPPPPTEADRPSLEACILSNLTHPESATLSPSPLGWTVRVLGWQWVSFQKFFCKNIVAILAKESRERVSHTSESRILAKMWSLKLVILVHSEYLDSIYAMSMSKRTSMCHLHIDVHGHTAFMPMSLLHVHVHAVCLCGCGHDHYDAAC